MDFNLKVQSKESGEIAIGEKYVNSAEYYYNTTNNNALDKSSDINVTLKITGSLSKDCKAQTKDLAKWSLMTKGADVYRKVILTIEDQENIIREYSLDEAFVLDYKESTLFDQEKIDYTDRVIWELLVSQKGDRLDGVKVKD